jgi:beta-phosphoglucomutase-like phosphatase (HAD superfamily)
MEEVMFDRLQSGYILPEGLTVISTVFDKVVNARNIPRQSEEGEWLAREALRLFMSGVRDAWELERRLKDARRPLDHSPPSGGVGMVVDLLPELTAWAQSSTASQRAATALTEKTLEYAIENIDEFVATSDVRRWLVRVMLDLRLGRRRGQHRT